MKTRITVAFGCLLFSLVAPRVSAQELEAYTVREGETCATIAERVYGSPRAYDRIHAHNPDLGPLPHHLHAGQVLQLPMPRSRGVDATVTDARGSVRRQAPSQPAWAGARVGDELDSGARVSTGERSSAELTFRSSAVAAIRAETLVIVHGTSVERVREEGTRATVREGSVLSRLSSLSGGAPLAIETPSAEVSVGQGETAVRVSREGHTGVSALSGTSAHVRGTNDTSVIEVPVGQGTHVRRGRPPTPPRPLPAPPSWVSTERAFLGLAPTPTSLGGGTVTGTWSAVTGAASYHVEIARREDGRDLVFGANVPSSVTRFEAHGLPPGRYFVRIATIDAELLEGRPADAVALDVIGVELVPPGAVVPSATADDSLSELELFDGLADRAMTLSSAPPREPVLLGTRVVVPSGVVCAHGASEPSAELVLASAGDGYLTCVREGVNVVGFDLRVVAMRARVLDRAGAAITRLRREMPTDVMIEIDAPSLDRGALALRATGGEATPPTFDADGRLFTTLTPTLEVAGPLTLVVGNGQPDSVLASVEIAVDDPPPPEPVAPPEATESPRLLALHEGLGAQVMPSWVGLRDDQRTGIGGVLGAMVASARLGEASPRVRLIGGATAGLFDDYLRISAVAPLDVIGQSSRDADRGARDLYVSLGSRLLAASPTQGAGIAIELGTWAPTAGASGLDRGRLMFAVDGSLRFAERFVLRTRQAGIFDLVANGSLLWASAYGLDVGIAGPLSLGVEGTMTMGTEGGTEWYAGGVGLGMGLDFHPVVLSLAGRVGFGDDLWPQGTVALNVRASFDP
ncbi:MAG: LysM peptidoglycan-binding domain-containing protein [Deltaproteobacteria bacterium]|nr:LysM peptidoglycan-binding domain-containing protein [Deltaproteobacteria bacterium]